MFENEEWKMAVGFEGFYSVSSLGRVRSEDRTIVEKTGIVRKLKGKIITPKANRGGYLCLKFSREGRVIAQRVHRVVASAFLGKKPSEQHEVAHKDGNRANNRAENLRWDTRAGNFSDKLKHGTHNRGERHPNSKLSDISVSEIRASNKTSKEISIAHGISSEYAKRLISNQRRAA